MARKSTADIQAELAALIEAIFDKSVSRAQLVDMVDKVAVGGRK